MDNVFENLRRCMDSSSDDNDNPDDPIVAHPSVVDASADLAFNLLGVQSLALQPKRVAAPKFSKLQKASHAWERHAVLNHGDRFQADFGNPALRVCDLSKPHKNTWDAHGFYREGFKQIGAGGSAKSGDISHTEWELDVSPPVIVISPFTTFTNFQAYLNLINESD